MTFPADRTTSYRIAPHVMFEELGHEIVLLDMEKGMYFGLNATGKLIWQELRQGASVEQLAARLAELAEDRARVEVDLRAFLADLDKRGLITRDPPAHAG